MIAAFVAIPPWIAWRAWISGLAAIAPFEADGPAGVYLAMAATVGAASLVVKPWIESRRYDRSVMVQWKSDLLKLSPSQPDLLVGPLPRLLGMLPFNEATTISIDRKRLALPRLPAELDGLTIVHLSDLHMTGQLDRQYYQRLAREVNALRPDAIAITGDIVENEACQPWLAESLGQLCAPLGVYFILGNHDAFIDAERTRAELTELGLTCLSGRWLRAEWNGVRVLLGGNELPWMSPAANRDELPVHTAERAEFRLVLCHTPDQFGWCQQAGADLALAGHTHGGQVQLPLLGAVASPSLHGTRYACGVFRRGDTVLHVTRGISGETPLRWRCPPEIALLTLTGS